MSEQVMISRELLERLAVPKPDTKGWTTWRSSTAYTAAKELRAALDANPVNAQPAGEVPEVVVVAAAKALCKHHADICGVNSDDQWNVYSDDFIADAKIVLEAVQHTRIVASLQAKAVMMPPRMSAFSDDFPERHTAARWYNRALDEVARINGRQVDPLEWSRKHGIEEY